MARVAIALVGVLVLAAAITVAAGVASYNRLVTLDEAVGGAWGQVENVYQRRADLVPNLVETVKGARDFERQTLVEVTEARARVGQIRLAGAPSAEQLAAFQGAQDELTSALSRLLLVVERYPELRATESFRDLQSQLEGTENRIAVERRRFNEAALAYNTARRRFPASLLAGTFGFGEKPYFAAAEGADRPPSVEFGSGG